MIVYQRIVLSLKIIMLVLEIIMHIKKLFVFYVLIFIFIFEILKFLLCLLNKFRDYLHNLSVKVMFYEEDVFVEIRESMETALDLILLG
jgi:hypothetical protein